jgi:hypothetical protein
VSRSPRGASSASFHRDHVNGRDHDARGISGSYGGVNKTANLTVTAQPLPTVSTLTVSPSTVTGARELDGHRQALGGGAEWRSARHARELEHERGHRASIGRRPSGQLTATFTVTTIAATSNRSAVISASYNSTTTSATISVKKRRN